MLKPERILVMASTFPAAGHEQVPSFVRDLILAMKNARPEVEFAVVAPQLRGALPAYTRHQGFEEFRFSYMRPRNLERLTEAGILPSLQAEPWLASVVPFLFRGLRRATVRLVHEWKPQLLHAHWFTPQGIVAAQVSKAFDVPMLLTTHASDVSIWRKVPLLGRQVVRRRLPQATRITAVSAATLRRASSFFSESEWEALQGRVSVLPMGVTVSPDAAGVSRRARQAGQVRTVLYVGRFAEKKGVGDLIAAFAQLRRSDLRLVLAGAGPSRQAIEEEVRRAGLCGQVNLPGFVTGEAKRQLLATASVLVIPSVATRSGDAEGLPVTLLEGLAAGIPVVATDASNAAEILEDGKSGWIVPQRNPAALARGIARALDLTVAQLTAISSAGLACVADLSWPRVAQRHWEIIDGIEGSGELGAARA